MATVPVLTVFLTNALPFDNGRVIVLLPYVYTYYYSNN